MNRSIALSFALSLTTLACNRPPAGLHETRTRSNVAYVQRGDRTLCMDVVMPLDAPAPRPAVLLFHGGGWIGGKRSDLRDMTLFLGSMGYTAATASYRLCDNETHHPVPVQDALAALKFLRRNASEFGIDPDRIAVGGESAGAQLALLVGLVKDPSIFEDDSFPGVSARVSAVIDIYGPSHLGPGYDQSGFLARRMLDAYMGCPPGRCPEQWRQASPVAHVRPDAPPVLIIHGNCDSVVHYGQATELNEALSRAGAYSLLVRVSGAGHGWGYFFNEHSCMRTLPSITHFLATVFPASPGLLDKPGRT